jgi:hypothetical protein
MLKTLEILPASDSEIIHGTGSMLSCNGQRPITKSLVKNHHQIFSVIYQDAFVHSKKSFYRVYFRDTHVTVAVEHRYRRDNLKSLRANIIYSGWQAWLLLALLIENPIFPAFAIWSRLKALEGTSF